jgi:hypothetical protein
MAKITMLFFRILPTDNLEVSKILPTFAAIKTK